MSLFDGEQRHRETEQALRNLKVGDWFHEMYAHVEVVRAIHDDGTIVTEVRDGTKKLYQNAKELEDYFSYDYAVAGYWVMYGGNMLVKKEASGS